MEDSWLSEARQVRGIPKPDPVGREAKKVWSRYRDWHPTMDDMIKVTAVVSILGIIIYAYAAHKSKVISHG